MLLTLSNNISTPALNPPKCIAFGRSDIHPSVFLMSPSSLLHMYTLLDMLRHVLHKYTNEDVSLGAWFIGLDVQHIDDRRLCCGTPPGKAHLFFSSV